MFTLAAGIVAGIVIAKFYPIVLTYVQPTIDIAKAAWKKYVG